MPEVFPLPSAPTPRVPRTIFQHAHTDGSAAFPPPTGGGITAEIFLLTPDNLNGLDSLTLWILSGLTEAATFTITLNIGSCNELFNIHTQTVNNHAVNLVIDEYECVDLTVIFAVVLANLGSRDMIWITIENDAETLQYVVGLELQES